jgi:hypothetical protein
MRLDRLGLRLEWVAILHLPRGDRLMLTGADLPYVAVAVPLAVLLATAQTTTG